VDNYIHILKSVFCSVYPITNFVIHLCRFSNTKRFPATWLLDIYGEDILFVTCVAPSQIFAIKSTCEKRFFLQNITLSKKYTTTLVSYHSEPYIPIYRYILDISYIRHINIARVAHYCLLLNVLNTLFIYIKTTWESDSQVVIYFAELLYIYWIRTICFDFL